MSTNYFVKIVKDTWSSCRVVTNHPSISKDLFHYLSCFADNYKFMPKYKLGVWDGKLYFMERNGKIGIGLISHVYKFCKSLSIPVVFDDGLIEKYDEVDNDFLEVTDSWINEDISPRSYQLIGAVKAIKHQRGILEHATSSGKSLTLSLILQYNLIKKRITKALILVPTLGLIEQMYTDLISYGVPEDLLGKYSGLEKNPDAVIVISTWQSMAKKPELCEKFDAIICDETHNLKGAVIRSVSENCKNAFIRIGCTGSMPESKPDKLSVESSLGIVIHKVTARELIDSGHISDIKIKIPYITYPEKITNILNSLPWDDEKEYLEKNQTRNNIIQKIVEKHTNVGHNTLILVEHIDHAKELNKYLSQIEGSQTFVITGKVEVEKRNSLRKYMNENSKIITIATYGVFSTGVSINRLHSVIFASPSKSKTRVLQSVGRGLRMHKDKKRLLLYDIADNCKHAKKLLQERVDIYSKAEFEIEMFEINIGEINGTL